MTFKEFAKKTLLFPATVFSGLTEFLLGSYQRTRTGDVTTQNEGDKQVALTNRGLLGNVLDGIKYVGRATSNFVYNHKQAIAIAFWASLVLAGAAALTVFLWPAALTAVATFTIAGLSIAGVVGANAMAQIGAVAALTAVATSVAVYATAAVVNTISALNTFFASRARTQQSANEATITTTNPEETVTSSASKLSSLGGNKAVETPFLQAQHTAPIHTNVLKTGKDNTVVESSSEEPAATIKVN